MNALFDKDFDFVFSLGASCGCATYLRRHALRDCSSPFDWLITAPFETRIALLESGFAGFALKENLRLLPPKESNGPVNGNAHYEDVATKLRFFHDFPASVPFDEQYKVVKEKYDRRVARTLARLDAPGQVLLVWWSRTGERLEAEALVAALERLARRFPKPTLHLLVCENAEGASGLDYEQVSDRIIRVVGPLAPPKSGTNGDQKVNDAIFGRIRNSRAQGQRSKAKLKRLLVRCLSWPHPTKDGRARLRRALEHRFGLD